MVPGMPRRWTRPSLVALALFACGQPGDGSTGSSEGSGTSSTDATTGAESGTGSTGAESSTGATAPTSTGGEGAFAAVYEVLIANNCTSVYCHGDMGLGGLSLGSAAEAYAELVDVAAATPVCMASTRVVPGAPDESILWLRVRPAALDGGDTCAPKMPQGSTGISDVDAQVILDWIEAGAPE